MKYTFVLLLAFSLDAKAQSAEDLLNRILEVNRLESEMRGLEFPFDSTGEPIPPSTDYTLRSNYDNFQVLKNNITRTELISLTGHKSGVIRIFAARELIKELEPNFDYFKFIKEEISKNDTIESQYGCIISNRPTYIIFLQDLAGDWNSASYNKEEKKLNFLNAILKPVDEYLIRNYPKHQSYLIEPIFDRELFSDSLLSMTKNILLSTNSYGAFKYLQKKNHFLFARIKPRVVENVLRESKSGNEKRNESLFWFFRYFVSTGQMAIATEMLDNLTGRKLNEEELDFQLMGLKKSSIRKFKRNYR